MLTINRFRKMFRGDAQLHGDKMFQSYYGNLISTGQEGGPSAAEARRDFEGIRTMVSRVSIY